MLPKLPIARVDDSSDVSDRKITSHSEARSCGLLHFLGRPIPA